VLNHQSSVGARINAASCRNLNNPRNLRYNLNSPILALSANVEGDRIVVAGREVLRILRVGYTEITEEANLRLPGEQKRHFQYDVKWGTSPQKNVIATAGTNGTICLYDIKEGRLDRMLREHGRQVHRLAFNQANGNLLLSASQDGTIKLWDLRERKSRHTFVGKAEAVRDVQFNAGNAVEFAAAFDNGAIQVCCLRYRMFKGGLTGAEMGLPQGKHLRAQDQCPQWARICS
jgi:WD40 repeat protein